LLRVVEEWVGVVVGQDDGGSHHGSRQGAAAGLVAPRLAAARYDVEG
jgi:hypothetical protein